MARNRNEIIDDRGTIEKVAAGDISALDGLDAVNAAQGASSFVGSAHKLGVLGGVPTLGALSVGLTGVGDSMQAEKEAKKIAHLFGDGDIRRAKNNPAVRTKLKDLDDRWQGSMLESGFVMLGGAVAGAFLGPIIGGIIGSFTLPLIGTIAGGTIGLILGSIIGGTVASYVYNSFKEDQAQDPLVINEQIIKMRAAGQEVPSELVFAALAANVSGKSGEKIDDTLKKYTDTKYWHEALGEEKNIGKISAMMHNQNIDNVIRAQTGMVFDQSNPNKSVAEQYADLINSGRLDPKELLQKGSGLYALPPAGMHTASYQAEVPNTPREQNARRREV